MLKKSITLLLCFSFCFSILQAVDYQINEDGYDLGYFTEVDLLEKYSPRRELGEDPQEEIEKWLQRRHGAKKAPRESLKEESESQEEIEIDLSTAISQTLKNQWDIKIAQREVLKQEGVYQSSKGPFDPVFGARVKNDILRSCIYR